MEKVEKEYRYDGETFTLEKESNGIKCFVNYDTNLCLVTDKDDNIILKIEADCSQNTGFLKVLD